MNQFEIITDSASSINNQLSKEYNIKVVSFTCMLNGVEMECYSEDTDYNETAQKFYQALRAGADAKTSLVNCEKIVKAVTPYMEQGKDILFVAISSNLSGTFAQAVAAADLLKEKFPERKMLVIDSLNASLGEGLIAIHASIMRSEGKSLEETYELLETSKLKFNSYVVVDELSHLRKGGRIPATMAIAGTLLNIKPVLLGDEHGKFASYDKQRGRKKAIDSMLRAFDTRTDDIENQIIGISHCDCADDVETLKTKLAERGVQNIIVSYFDVCTGAHIGPGALALFFIGKDRAADKEEKNNPLMNFINKLKS